MLCTIIIIIFLPVLQIISFIVIIYVSLTALIGYTYDQSAKWH